jgi:hypothetical protein
MVLTAVLVAAVLAPAAAPAADRCKAGASVVGDNHSLASLRKVIDDLCPCGFYDGTSKATDRSAFNKCVKERIKDASDGTPLSGFALRPQCKGTLQQIYKLSTCGYGVSAPRVACCEVKPANGKKKASIKKVGKCVDSGSGSVVRHACAAFPFTAEACSNDATNSCVAPSIFAEETVDLPSAADPAHTPGTSGVVVTNPKLLTQFGGGSFSLNNARYTRHHLAAATGSPDAILSLVPGFEGGAGTFRILAQNLIARSHDEGFTLEVWAYDRRSNQLEDLAGADIAEHYASAEIALDWFFGGELGLSLHPLLSGPNRRAVFYDAQADVPFIAQWTPLVFSRDIDVIVTAARAAATNQNVFLGGHSAGTGFTARYAATDFNFTGVGPADPGYAKLRGLVLLEGGGGSTGNALSNDTLDRIEAKFDGGLYGAVRDNAARCVDGTTPCTLATEAADCVGQLPPVCTPPTTSYAVSPLLNARILTAGEVSAIQSIADPDQGENVLRVDQGAAGNNAIAVVPDLGLLGVLPHATAYGSLGSFLDDDGLVAPAAPFVATSMGGLGIPNQFNVRTWNDITEGVNASLIPNNGPPPTTLPGGVWGQEREVTRTDRLVKNFYVGATNFTDTYYPSSGLSVTSVTGVCTAGTCTAGNVGASCTTAAQCSQAINLDSSALSIGRNRRDIENLTQAAAIDIPVIAFGGTNGLVPVAGGYTPFGTSIGVCTAPSCDGTPRVVDAGVPNPAFPTFGGVNGGFEVVMAEGFAHVDVVTAEDTVVNPVTPALVAFLKRNVQ